MPKVESEGFLVGSTYLTSKGVEVKVLEITDWKNPTDGKYMGAVIVSSLIDKETAGYDLQGNPLTSIAAEWGYLKTKTSGMDKRRA